METSKVKPSKTYHIYLGPGKPYKVPVEKRFKDIYGQYLVVYRWYGRHKQWWHYVMEYESVLLAKVNRVKEGK